MSVISKGHAVSKGIGIGYAYLYKQYVAQKSETLISENASVSTHFAIYFVAVRMKDFFFTSLVWSSRGPTILNAHMAKGHGVTRG